MYGFGNADTDPGDVHTLCDEQTKNLKAVLNTIQSMEWRRLDLPRLEAIIPLSSTCAHRVARARVLLDELRVDIERRLSARQNLEAWEKWPYKRRAKLMAVVDERVRLCSELLTVAHRALKDAMASSAPDPSIEELHGYPDPNDDW